MARTPWKTFTFFGLEYRAYKVKANSAKLVYDTKEGPCHALAIVFLDDRELYFGDSLTDEQLRILLAHEIQHIVEDFANVDYLKALSSEDVADSRTDLVAKGWVYLIRHNPKLIDYLKGDS